MELAEEQAFLSHLKRLVFKEIPPLLLLLVLVSPLHRMATAATLKHHSPSSPITQLVLGCHSLQL